MRVNALSTPVASRPTETQSLVAQKPAVEAKPAEIRQLPGRPVDSFFDPSLLKRPDAQTRATQGDQLHDIADGVRNGSLTEQEAQKLLAEQQKIADAQKEAMADGKLTLGERLKLAMMQGRAGQNIDSAKGNSDRDVFARFDKDAQRQAGQIDQLANGRTSGNITHSEAGKLIGQQAEIAGARNNQGALSELVTGMKQSEAQKDLDRHSKPGTQFDFDIKNLPPFYMKAAING
ncbi:hypothetical protein [Hyalangium minutum]|uniref:Uncharacterized protein n=1 Tax=Hyalangium minutum TaxID=394096 RepID=A0A085VZD4_9BACT|nr:hypothetical protein [Hyalangium minutum]KFE60797.1 hypothetical protein DB31_4710 [Hyalangium minutum]